MTCFTIVMHVASRCHPEKAPRPTKDLLQHRMIPCDFHVSIPERRHIRLQRGTEAAKDSSTPLGVTCVAINTDRWQPGFRYPGQTRTRSRIEAAFRTIYLRIPRFLDSSDRRQKSPGDRVSRAGADSIRRSLSKNRNSRVSNLRMRLLHLVFRGLSIRNILFIQNRQCLNGHDVHTIR